MVVHMRDFSGLDQVDVGIRKRKELVISWYLEVGGL